MEEQIGYGKIVSDQHSKLDASFEKLDATFDKIDEQLALFKSTLQTFIKVRFDIDINFDALIDSSATSATEDLLEAEAQIMFDEMPTPNPGGVIEVQQGLLVSSETNIEDVDGEQDQKQMSVTGNKQFSFENESDSMFDTTSDLVLPILSENQQASVSSEKEINGEIGGEEGQLLSCDPKLKGHSVMILEEVNIRNHGNYRLLEDGFYLVVRDAYHSILESKSANEIEIISISHGNISFEEDERLLKAFDNVGILEKHVCRIVNISDECGMVYTYTIGFMFLCGRVHGTLFMTYSSFDDGGVFLFDPGGHENLGRNHDVIGLEYLLVALARNIGLLEGQWSLQSNLSLLAEYDGTLVNVTRLDNSEVFQKLSSSSATIYMGEESIEVLSALKNVGCDMKAGFMGIPSTVNSRMATLVQEFFSHMSAGSLRFASTIDEVNPVVRFNYCSNHVSVEKCVSDIRNVAAILQDVVDSVVFIATLRCKHKVVCRGAHKVSRYPNDLRLLSIFVMFSELYAAFDPLEDKIVAIEVCSRVCQLEKNVTNLLSSFLWLDRHGIGYITRGSYMAETGGNLEQTSDRTNSKGFCCINYLLLQLAKFADLGITFYHPWGQGCCEGESTYEFRFDTYKEFKQGTCAKEDSCKYIYGISESCLQPHPTRFCTQFSDQETTCLRKLEKEVENPCFVTFEVLWKLYGSEPNADIKNRKSWASCYSKVYKQGEIVTFVLFVVVDEAKELQEKAEDVLKVIEEVVTRLYLPFMLPLARPIM